MGHYRTKRPIGVRIGPFLGLVFLILMPSCLAVGRESSLLVKPGESIQAAIDSAPEGATICLETGVWEENLTIGRSLTLRGPDSGKAVLRSAKGGRPVVWVWTVEERAQNVSVTLEHLSITGAFGHDPHWPERGAYGILAQDDVRVEITRCTISENRWSGIALLNEAEVVIQESTISENGWYGVWLMDATTAIVVDSHISTNAGGIWFQGTSEGGLYGTVVSDSLWKGIWADQSSKTSIIDCRVEQNGDGGIRVGNHAHVMLSDNLILQNEGYGLGMLQSTCCGAVFHGYVAGRRNVIPNPGEEHGNARGGFFPSELEFLVTVEGGEWVGDPLD